MPPDQTKAASDNFERQVSAFLDTTFQGEDEKEFQNVLRTMKATTVMSPDCKVVVNMPVFCGEPGVKQALSCYGPQGDVPFEVALLVNGPEGVDIRESRAYKDIVSFQAEYARKVNIVLTMANFPRKRFTIGRARKILTGVTLENAVGAGVKDLQDMVLVTHDADMKGLPPGYLKRVYHRFQADPNLAGLAGLVDFPEDVFSSNHVFLAIKKFADIFALLTEHDDNYVTMKGLNSAFRVQDYVTVGGYRDQDGNHEHRNMFGKLRKRERDVEFDRRMVIVSEARREIASLYKGRSAVNPHEGSLRQNIPSSMVGETPAKYRVTSPEFIRLLESQLNIFYEIRSNKKNDPKRMQQRMSRAAFFTGIKIEWKDDEKLVITDARILREKIFKKYPL